jgi:hypothetical protein
MKEEVREATRKARLDALSPRLGGEVIAPAICFPGRSVINAVGGVCGLDFFVWLAFGGLGARGGGNERGL